MAKDLQLGVQHIKDNYRQAEEEAAKCTPALFREYQEADEETKEELLVSHLFRFSLRCGANR